MQTIDQLLTDLVAFHQDYIPQILAWRGFRLFNVTGGAAFGLARFSISTTDGYGQFKGLLDVMGYTQIIHPSLTLLPSTHGRLSVSIYDGSRGAFPAVAVSTGSSTVKFCVLADHTNYTIFERSPAVALRYHCI